MLIVIDSEPNIQYKGFEKQLRIEVHFVFFHIMKEVWQHPELMDTYLVGNN